MFWNCDVKKTLERPLDRKEIKLVNPKGNKSWIFIGRTDVEAETPIFWPPDVKNWLIWKDPDAGKDWRWAEKGMTKDEMVGWHHWLDGHEFEQAPRIGEGQGSLTCCSPWGQKESEMTERLHWTDLFSWNVRRKNHIVCVRGLATGLEKVSSHSNPKERQRQRKLKLSHNCNHLTH